MSNKEILDLITSKENEIKKLQEEVRILKLKANEYSDEIKTFSNEDKIKIFMDYFKGREDTYPYLSIDKNNPTKKYYIPVCNNE